MLGPSPARQGPCALTFSQALNRPTSSSCVVGRCVSGAAVPTSATVTHGWKRTVAWILVWFSCDSRRLSARPGASCWKATALAVPRGRSCLSRGPFRSTRACLAPPGRSRPWRGAQRALHALLVASWGGRAGARVTCADMAPSRRAAGPRRSRHAGQVPSRMGWGPLSARFVHLARGRLEQGHGFVRRATVRHILAARGIRPVPSAGRRQNLPRDAALR